jgi:histidinol-phosphate aminotransferase
MNNIEHLLRDNIRRMRPYSSARSEYHGQASIYLDANENPYGMPFSRYPDPLQTELKESIARVKGVSPEQIFAGNGSDEAIDLIIRAFCEPRRDNLVTITPSYGMYEVACEINDVECRKASLEKDYALNADSVLSLVDEHTKVIILCSPNNPTGNVLETDKIERILGNFKGIVVIDEAYGDFADADSFILSLRRFPNLIVLQTLSKARGAAGLRLGMAFADKEIIDVLNRIKYPYNVSSLVQEYALKVLEREDVLERQIIEIKSERGRLARKLSELNCVHKVYPSEANFILAKVEDANTLYNRLVELGIIVRNRTNVSLCENCLRITVGTPEENNELIAALGSYEL